MKGVCGEFSMEVSGFRGFGGGFRSLGFTGRGVIGVQWI